MIIKYKDEGGYNKKVYESNIYCVKIMNAMLKKHANDASLAIAIVTLNSLLHNDLQSHCPT